MSESYVENAIAGFNCQIASLIQPLRLGTRDDAAIARALTVIGAGTKTLLFIRQHYLDLGVTLANIKPACQSLNPKSLVVKFSEKTKEPLTARELFNVGTRSIVVLFSKGPSSFLAGSETLGFGERFNAKVSV